MTALDDAIVAFFAASGTPAYLVGGAVRDRLLGRRVHDFDLVVPEGALSLARRLADALRGAYMTLDADRATGRVLMGEDQVDIALQRGDSLTADLLARDFTMNAMAISVADWLLPDPPVIDPTGGQADLSARIIRAPAEMAFQQDPARMLRAPRLAVQLGCRIDPTTREWIMRTAPALSRASLERVRDELWRALALANTEAVIGELDQLGLLELVLPELAATRGVTQRPPHTLDVYDHSVLTLSNVEAILGSLDIGIARPAAEALTALAGYAPTLRRHLLVEPVPRRPRWTLLKFVALLHDIGKPETRTVKNGIAHFFGHEVVGARIIEEVAQRLRLSSREIGWLASVVRYHLRPLQLSKLDPPTPRSLYRFFRDAGDAAPEILLLSIADNWSKGSSLSPGEGADPVLDFARHMFELLYAETPAAVVSPPTLVNGRDLQAALGLAPGPRIGRLLATLREAAATGKVQTREQALELARRLARRSDDERTRQQQD